MGAPAGVDVEAIRAENEELRKENEELKAQLEELNKRVCSLFLFRMVIDVCFLQLETIEGGEDAT